MKVPRILRRAVSAGLFLGAGALITGLVGDSDALAQTKAPGGAKGITRGDPRTPLSPQTRAEVHKRVQASYAKLSAHERAQLDASIWGLHVALRDSSPAPHLPLSPPADPPPQKPCKACGSTQAYPSDPCALLRADLRKLSDDAILKGLVRDALQAAKQSLVDLEFYGGVADLVVDIVTTTANLATAGAGGTLGKAATSALKGIAMNQIQGAIMGGVTAMLPPPLDAAVSGELTSALVDQLLAAANKSVVDANKKKNAKMAELQKCQAGYSATLKAIDASNAGVLQCKKANPAYCL
jgi:hypothetical protein